MQIQRDGKEEIRANLNDEHRGLLDVYTPYDLKRLESRCSKLILDCIDWSHTSKMDLIELYDVLYSLYCAKLTEDGHPKNYEDQLRAFIDEGKAEARKPKQLQARRDEESLAWYVFACLAVVLVAIYYLVLLFTICDDQTMKERELKEMAIKKRQDKEKAILKRTAEKALPLTARKLGAKND
jgi:hypothetical protein